MKCPTKKMPIPNTEKKDYHNQTIEKPTVV